MDLPGIILIGSQYFVKVDESAFLLPDEVKTMEQSVAYLLMYYYILNLNYPEPLKFVFGFFERLVEINLTVDCLDLKKVYGEICAAAKEK